MNYIRLTLILLIFAEINISGQIDSIDQIKVIARAKSSEIILRWAPSTPYAWQQANKYGYTIERITMTQKNKLLKTRSIKVLTKSPIRPFTEDQWEKVVKDEKGNIDQYAAIAVQSLYGSSFEITENYSNNFTKVVEKAEENEKRFTFALFAADQSLKVAEAMGLLYTDKEVAEDERYFYRIFANVPKGISAIDTGYVYVGLSDNGELPRPIDFTADFEDKTVTLTWNRILFERIYTDYIVERSINGKEFYPISDLPFVNTSPFNKPNPRLVYRMDSLPEYDKTYYYRVKGRTPFDEYGPWSDTISGQSTLALNFRPGIDQVEILDNKKIKVKWNFPEEHNKEIEYISVYRANKADGDYKALGENLNPGTRSYIDEQPMPSNYYIVRLFDRNNKSSSSFPVLAQLVDSFPPEKPYQPVASIDTLGNVTLKWKKGKEEDIFGYRVFRANFKDNEFGQITHETITDTFFREQINIESLTRKIYYKIAAIDYNFNQSELSEAVLLLKPDIVPPVPPLFKPYKSTKKGVELNWINSSSKDVIKHVLYRRKAGDENWTTIAVFPIRDSVNSFIDQKIEAKLLFEYILIAVDSANNESKPCKSIFARKIDNAIRPPIKDIKFDIDLVKKEVEIKWEYPYQDIKSFAIYRAQSNEPLRFYKTIPKELYTLVDTMLEMNTEYRYRIKAIFTDGSESSFSEEILVKY